MNEQFKSDFHYGVAARSYQVLGCHMLHNDTNSAVFRTYAPRADEIYVLGDFNNWEFTHKMERVTEEGIFEITIDNVYEYQHYRYYINTMGTQLQKIDPYGYHHETNGKVSSLVYDIDAYKWNDKKYLNQRAKKNVFESPINIYEVHMGSFKRYYDNNYFDYRKLADELIPYVKEMGYTHIETMPLTEYPYDPSWGYQVTGYFAVTSRYGVPADYMYFIDKCHEAGIGVIMDWVPAHFPKDGYGLFEFDGAPLYEYEDPLKMEHKEWGTRIFNYEKAEVKSFLASSAMFFFDKYHIDGIRVDAVASMLYLDYGRSEYRPNVFGGNYNLEAIEFLKSLNHNVFGAHPDVLMIAEESTSFPGVTRPPYADGLGFNYKWNMGWMNDTLRYMHEDPINRRFHHNKMNFSLVYAYSENFILPISHDEVVYGKGSLLGKMPGDYVQKFANMRAYLGYMYTHPGKKLMFMGCEFAQYNEWNYNKELDWELLRYYHHQKMQDYVKDLNHLYLNTKPLYELDHSEDGFKWINGDEANYNIYTYRRIDKKGNEVVVILNFSGNSHHYYRLGCPKGTYKEVLNSDDMKYGGSGFINEPVIESDGVCWNGYDDSIVVRAPAFSCVVLQRVKKTVSKKEVSGEVKKPRKPRVKKAVKEENI